MDPRTRLTSNLVAESEAYGYTLTVWGAGAILINQYGTPQITQIFLYVGGALLGFASLGVIAFDQLVTEPEAEDNQRLVVASMVHIVSTLGNLFVAYLLVEFGITYEIPEWSGFLLVGFQATFTYNALLLLEDVLSKRFVDFVPFGEELE